MSNEEKRNDGPKFKSLDSLLTEVQDEMTDSGEIKKNSKYKEGFVGARGWTLSSWSVNSAVNLLNLE